ncbi:MAG: hypothetical protein ACP5N9_00985 [Candidatus Bilamarchaeum sp.]|jgi:membrane protein implicated in regulation of membrane protease activity
MRLVLFGKLILLSICISLLLFGLLSYSPIDSLKILAILTVISVVVTYAYPNIRGVKKGDYVSVVNNSNVPALMGRIGTAVQSGKIKEQIVISLDNGSEIKGIIESYEGLISKPKVRVVYEEKLVEA